MAGWMKWVVVLMALLEAGWFAFDGTRALIVGDYVTPKAGRHAGRLGPWSHFVQAVGVEPRSTLMKSIFTCYGTIWICIIVAFVFDLSWSHWAMLAAAAGAAWYLPFGTLLSVLQILGLLFGRSSPSGA